jgi:hypothetical protein
VRAASPRARLARPSASGRDEWPHGSAAGHAFRTSRPKDVVSLVAPAYRRPMTSRRRTPGEGVCEEARRVRRPAT